MNRAAFFPLLCFLTFLLSCSNQSFEQNLQVVKSSNAFIGKVDSIVINKMNQYNIPGLSIGIVRNDSIIFAKGYGVRSIKRNNPVTERTIFHTASISKLFTASAIVKLVDQGRLSLENKLWDIIPELHSKDARIKKITIKDLLNHTSGLPDVKNYHWEKNNQSNSSLRDYIADLDLELESDPSTTYSYSNLGYNLLGRVIEKRAELSFEDYLKNEILTPSGMVFSDFRFYHIPDSLATSPHTINKITAQVVERDVYPYTREHAASSTLNASAIELSKWMISYMKKG